MCSIQTYYNRVVNGARYDYSNYQLTLQMCAPQHESRCGSFRTSRQTGHVRDSGGVVVNRLSSYPPAGGCV